MSATQPITSPTLAEADSLWSLAPGIAILVALAVVVMVVVTSGRAVPAGPVGGPLWDLREINHHARELPAESPDNTAIAAAGIARQ